jgi:drug/metabolite transporter (DMT)-like permease
VGLFYVYVSINFIREDNWFDKIPAPTHHKRRTNAILTNMNIYLFALIPPFLFAITNYIDKFIITKYFKEGGIGSLMIFSSIISIIALPVIYFIQPDILRITNIEKLVIIGSGILSLLGILLYLYAINEKDVSSVVPLFQLIPVFSLIFGWLVLKESLNIYQIIGGFLIIGGSIFLSKEPNEKIRFKNKVVWLMFFASLLISLSGLLFKIVAMETDYWTTAFWSYVGALILSIIFFMCIKSWRKEFLHTIVHSGKKIIGLNMLNEIVNALGFFTLTYATLLAPLAVVYFINGIQSLFVLIIGLLLTLMFPMTFQENIERKNVLRKLLCIAVMMLGLACIMIWS